MPRKKRRRSWGSITVINRDKHILRWVENTPSGRKRRSRTVECSYKEACFEMSRLEVEHSDDRPVPTIGAAYKMWYEPWLTRRLADGKTKQRTKESYDSCWDKIIKPKWERNPIDSTPPAEVQKWLLEQKPYNAKIALIVLKKIGDFAMHYEVTPSNKFRIPYEMPTTLTRVKRTDTYTLEEANSIFAKVEGRNVEVPFILACFGSARTGESLGVRVSEVVPMESHGHKFAVVPIIRRMDHASSLPLPDGDLKTPESERVVVIPDPYASRLIAISKQRTDNGVEWLADRDDGMPHNIGTLNYAWKQALGEEEIPFSNLRATWRTIAKYEWGIDSDTLEILMGHVINTTSGKHYIKPKVENLVDAVARAMVQFVQT